MKSTAFITLFTLVALAGIGTLTVINSEAPPLPVPAQPEPVEGPRQVAPAPTQAPYVAQPSPPPDEGVYRCIIAGRTIYQDRPCETGRQAVIERGTVSVVPRHPVDPYKQKTPESRGPNVAMINRDTPQDEHMECPNLRKRLLNIDAQARHRSTARLTEERRNVGKRMSELKCSHMD